MNIVYSTDWGWQPGRIIRKGITHIVAQDDRERDRPPRRLPHSTHIQIHPLVHWQSRVFSFPGGRQQQQNWLVRLQNYSLTPPSLVISACFQYSLPWLCWRFVAEESAATAAVLPVPLSPSTHRIGLRIILLEIFAFNLSLICPNYNLCQYMGSGLSGASS